MQDSCSIEGCDKAHRARGLCGTHYAAYRRGEAKIEARAAKETQARICEQCRGPIPPLRRNGVMYCGPACKRKAQYAKEKAAPEPGQPNPPCSVEGCITPRLAKGMCQKHYTRMRSKGSLDDIRKNARGMCTVDGCDQPHRTKGMCDRHHTRTKAAAARLEWKKSQADRPCLHCGKPIGIERRTSAMFCSRRCKEAETRASGRGAESVMKSYFKTRYGMTIDQVNEAAAAGCAICGTLDWPGKHARPHVDHDHKTGLVRGILCSECNTGLGKFKDDPALLQQAIAYLGMSAEVVPASE